MKRLRILVIAVVMLGTFGLVSSVSAETVRWAESFWTGDYGVNVDVTEGGTKYIKIGAGTFFILVDGGTLPVRSPSLLVPPVPPLEVAYCVDIDTSVSPDEYGATITPLDHIFSKNIAVVINQNPVSRGESTKAAAVQTAIWKLYYRGLEPPVGVTVYPTGGTDPIIEKMALGMIAAAAVNVALTYADLTVDATPSLADPNLIEVLVTGPAGSLVTLTTDQGSFVEGVLDGTGSLQVLIDLGGEVLLSPVTITAEIERPTAFLVRATSLESPSQDLVIVRPVPEIAQTTFNGDDYLGCPRTIGFWKHQFRQATSDPVRKSQVSKETLLSYLPIEIPFTGVTVSSLEEGLALLWLENATMQERALQQFFATWLNFLHGNMGISAMVDIDYDKVPDVPFYEALALFEMAWEDERYEDAKDIADSINNMCNEEESSSSASGGSDYVTLDYDSGDQGGDKGNKSGYKSSGKGKNKQDNGDSKGKGKGKGKGKNKKKK